MTRLVTQVLEVKQLNNLDTLTAMAITDEQKAKFTGEMKEALEYLLPKKRNGAIGNYDFQ